MSIGAKSNADYIEDENEKPSLLSDIDNKIDDLRNQGTSRSNLKKIDALQEQKTQRIKDLTKVHSRLKEALRKNSKDGGDFSFKARVGDRTLRFTGHVGNDGTPF